MSCNELDSLHISHYTSEYDANYFYLEEYFWQEQLASIEGDSTFKSAPNISLPKLPVQTPQFIELLAVMQKTKFSSSEAINATKADESIFTSLNHYVFEQLWQQQQTNTTFNIFNYRDWALLIVLIAVALLTITVFYLIFKIRALCILTALAAKPLTVRAAQEELSLHYNAVETRTPSNLIDISAFTAKIADLIPVDVSLLLVLSSCDFHYDSRSSEMLQTANFLIPNETLFTNWKLAVYSMVIPWATFDYAPEFYELTTEKQQDVRLEINSL
jgi:hypothetical protein